MSIAARAELETAIHHAETEKLQAQLSVAVLRKFLDIMSEAHRQLESTDTAGLLVIIGKIHEVKHENDVITELVVNKLIKDPKDSITRNENIISWVSCIPELWVKEYKNPMGRTGVKEYDLAGCDRL